MSPQHANGARISHQLVQAVTAWVVLIALALLPIGLGANRPIVWLISAIVFSVTVIVYVLTIRHMNGNASKTDPANPLWILLFICLLLFVGVQALPLGPWASPWQVVVHGEVIKGQALSLTPGMTNLSFAQFAIYGLLFWHVLQLARDRARAHFMLIGIFIIVIAHALFGMVSLMYFNDTLLFMEKWAYEGVATGTFVNRNSFATFLAFGAAIGCAYTAHPASATAPASSHPSKRVMFGIGTSIICITLFATQSRMGILAGVAGCLLTLVLVLIRLTMSAKVGMIVAFVGSIVLALALAIRGSAFVERFGSVSDSIETRLALYQQVWSMIMQHPFVGHGAGSFEVAFQLYHSPSISTELVWDKAHSTYLSLWAELGLIFGSIPMVLMVVFAFRLFRQAVSSPNRWFPACVALGVLCTAALHSLVDFSLEMHGVALIFTAVLALGLASNSGQAHENTQDR